jgi:peptidoglycan/LPS O-acetylase OafA/YrhL
MTENQYNRPRLLIIDEMKILGIAFVVLWHIVGGNLSIEYVAIPYRDIGLTLFIVASGMGLAYNTPALITFSEVWDFYLKRFFRIYPIYWFLILFLLTGLIIQHHFILPSWTLLDVLQTFSGFQAFVGDFGGRFSVTFWFVGLIVSLYILYPFMLWAHNRNKHVAIAAFFLISVVSTFFVSQWTSIQYPTLWFPLCRVFEFGLGIYLISIIDPAKVAYKNAALFLLADLTFYIYLTHYVLIGTAFSFGGLSLPVYIVMVFVSAYLLYRVDGVIHGMIDRYILKRPGTPDTGGQPERKSQKKRKSGIT